MNRLTEIPSPAEQQRAIADTYACLLATDARLSDRITQLEQATAPTLHVAHSYDHQPAQVRIKVERNSKGYNWEISAEGETIDQVLATVREANQRLAAEYGQNGQS